MHIGESQTTKSKLNLTMMKIVKFVKGNDLPRISNTKLYKLIGWKQPSQIIIQETVNFIHMTIMKYKVKKIFKTMRIPKS